MRIGEYLRSVRQRLGAVQERYIRMAVMLLYAVLHLLMAIVHEPWFDEAEAWQIAKSASLQTLLTEVTHYEGHPPLWHLILMPFAKAGAPYELSLTLISLAFTGAVVYLILRFSPFPLWVRVTLPFTYFFFYQYSVIARVYCVMMLEFVLLAMAYKYRNTKPVWYVGVMMLICVTNAYGIVLAGGLSIVWLWEIWRENCQKGFRWKSLVQDRRLWYLAGLLLVALMAICQIMPREDTYATSSRGLCEVRNPFWLRLLYMILILPADVTMTNVFSDDGFLSMTNFMPISLASGCIMGIIIVGLIVWFGRREHTLCLLAVPYLLFSLFASVVYFALHHMGIGLLFMLFWIWVSVEKQSKRNHGLRFDKSILKIAKGMTILSLCVSISWSVSACVLDMGREYSVGRSMAAFMKEYRLDQYRIMAMWKIIRDEEGEIIARDTNFCEGVVEIAPYFNQNIVYNFNYGRDDRNYITHISADEKQNAIAYETWKKEGYPEVLLMQPELSELYDANELSMRDYALVYYAPSELVWKNTSEYYVNYIYVRRDLLEKIGIEEIDIHNL